MAPGAQPAHDRDCLSFHRTTRVRAPRVRSRCLDRRFRRTEAALVAWVSQLEGKRDTQARRLAGGRIAFLHAYSDCPTKKLRSATGGCRKAPLSIASKGITRGRVKRSRFVDRRRASQSNLRTIVMVSWEFRARVAAPSTPDRTRLFVKSRSHGQHPRSSSRSANPIRIRTGRRLYRGVATTVYSLTTRVRGSPMRS